MPRVVKHPDLRRTELLDRASALFLEHGYDNFSLNDLIADARVSKGAFYHWFPSKDSLITALAQRSAHHHLAAVEDALAECNGNALDRLNAVLQPALRQKCRRARQSGWLRWCLCCVPKTPTYMHESSPSRRIGSGLC